MHCCSWQKLNTFLLSHEMQQFFLFNTRGSDELPRYIVITVK